jgi:NAD(P)-dependent dehydrogenase (short-subunit alcohol dehydrogenase family)
MARSVVITGGTGGLGAAVTRAFIEDDWDVVVPWVVPEELDRVERHDRLRLVEADLMDPASAAVVCDAAGDRLRALVNLVGGFAMGGRVHETPVEEFEAQLRLNLRPTYLMCAAALPVLLRAGGGAIVCVSSRAAVQPFAGAAGYITGKAAVLAFIQALDAEYKNDGIRCNAILPGLMNTPMAIEGWSEMTGVPRDQLVAARDAQVPLGAKQGTGWDIAYAALFLASDEAKFITGVLLPVDGGQSIKVG